MHGKGFRGATAAWVKPSIFIFRVADKGLGIGSSQEHGDGIGHMFIGNFATEPIRSKKQKNGHILEFCRDLEKVEMPEQLDFMGFDSIAADITFIQKRKALGKKLPQYHPDSRTYGGYDSKIGPFGASVTINRLGKIIKVKQFEKEPEPWD